MLAKRIKYLDDATQKWSHSTNVTNPGATNTSAEVITEGTGATGDPVYDYGTVQITGATVNGETPASSDPAQLEIATASGTVQTTCSAIATSGTAFSCTWKNY